MIVRTVAIVYNTTFNSGGSAAGDADFACEGPRLAGELKRPEDKMLISPKLLRRAVGEAAPRTPTRSAARNAANSGLKKETECRYLFRLGFVNPSKLVIVFCSLVQESAVILERPTVHRRPMVQGRERVGRPLRD